MGEQCDTKLDPDHCDEFCKCIGDYVGQGTGICGLCGNGVVDKTEECDIKTDPSHCTEYCTCIDEWVPDLLDIVSGDCTQCGNGVLDGGEECDDDMDPNYCEGCACQDSSSPNGKVIEKNIHAHKFICVCASVTVRML